MLKIERAKLEQLGFDFDKALNQLKRDREAHKKVLNVPPPTAHPLVEEALDEGGYEIIEPPEPTPPDPEFLRRVQELQANRELSLAMLSDWKTLKSDQKLDALREILEMALKGDILF